MRPCDHLDQTPVSVFDVTPTDIYDDPLDFTDRSVLVTGGSRGLGKVLAATFLEAGADVMTCARNEPAAPVTTRDGAREAAFIAADVRDPKQVAAVVAAAVERSGRIDVLLNNAGGAPAADSATASSRFNEKIVALNLLAPMAFCQAVYPIMDSQQNGGVILNVSSVSGTRPNPQGMAYGAAKAGLENMTKTLAHEWGPNIRVVGVTVGMIVTDESAAFYGDTEAQASIANNLAARRLGRPDDIADMCLALASPLARWVTGTCLEIHGGGEGPAYLGATPSSERS